jgi:hypothetical protein
LTGARENRRKLLNSDTRRAVTKLFCVNTLSEEIIDAVGGVGEPRN